MRWKRGVANVTAQTSAVQGRGSVNAAAGMEAERTASEVIHVRSSDSSAIGGGKLPVISRLANPQKKGAASGVSDLPGRAVRGAHHYL